MRIVPDVGSISRLIIRSVVVLPQPELPSEDDDLAGLDRERQVVDGDGRRRAEALGDVSARCSDSSAPQVARANVSIIRPTSGPSGYRIGHVQPLATYSSTLATTSSG